MEITFVGLSCLRLRGRQREVVVDPFPEGVRGPQLAPDIVVATEGGTDAPRLRPAPGRPQLVSGPGEYELGGVRIHGHAGPDGITVMRVEVDDVGVVALGRLRSAIPEELVDALGHVDVLAVPVGGGDALGPAAAAAVVSQLEPAYVVPVRFAVPGLPGDHEPVERFATEMGLAEGWASQARLTLSGGVAGGEETRVVILEARAAAAVG